MRMAAVEAELSRCDLRRLLFVRFLQAGLSFLVDFQQGSPTRSTSMLMKKRHAASWREVDLRARPAKENLGIAATGADFEHRSCGGG